MALLEGHELQRLSSSDEEGAEATATSAVLNQQLSLLGVPAGVENLVVSFVASGVGGLKNALNLRYVCKTTQSWVDNLPKAQADVVFSKTHVIVDYDVQSIRRFSLSPPKFGVNAICLKMGALPVGAASSEEEKEWRVFVAWCHSKLETLELRTKDRYGQPVKVSGRLLELLDSTKIARLELSGSVVLEENSPLPSCLRTLEELRLNETYRGGSRADRNHFYAQLEENATLRVLSVDVIAEDDFVRVAEFVDTKKADPRLKLIFDLRRTNLFRRACDLDDPQVPGPHERHRLGEMLRRFGMSIFGSKSNIRLYVEDLDDFEEVMSAGLPRAAVVALLAMIESVGWFWWREDWFSLRENLPRLKALMHLCPEESPFDLRQLTFPPSLEYLGFYGNVDFPIVANLPKSLKVLSVDNYECNLSSFVGTMKLLGGQCPGLKSLSIGWELTTQQHDDDFGLEASPVDVDFEGGAGGLSTIEWLRIFGEVESQERMAEWAVGISNAFDWRTLKLEYLYLSISQFGDDQEPLAVMDEGTMRLICEGPSASSLLHIEVKNESVTPEALPLLKKLRSSAAANWERLEKTEGRAGRQRLYKKMEVDKPEKTEDSLTKTT